MDKDLFLDKRRSCTAFTSQTYYAKRVLGRSQRTFLFDFSLELWPTDVYILSERTEDILLVTAHELIRYSRGTLFEKPFSFLHVVLH